MDQNARSEKGEIGSRTIRENLGIFLVGVFFPDPKSCDLLHRFLTCPELIVCKLIAERLAENECLVVHGFERFSKVSGYSDRFRWARDFHDKTEVENGHRKVVVAAGGVVVALAAAAASAVAAAAAVLADQ